MIVKTDRIVIEDVKQMQGFTGGDFSVEDIVDRVNKGQWQAAYITNEKKEKLGTIVFLVVNCRAFIFATTGKNITTQQNWKDVKNFFKSLGAAKIEAAMRDSTLRLLKRFGFSKKYNIVEIFL